MDFKTEGILNFKESQIIFRLFFREHLEYMDKQEGGKREGVRTEENDNVEHRMGAPERRMRM